MSSPIDQLKERLYEVNALNAASALMDWDQQCYMPRGAAEARAEQGAVLSKMAHEIFVSDETQAILEKAGSEVDPSSEEGALVRVVKRDMDQRTKLPVELVTELSRHGAIGHEVWVEARAESDYSKFQPILEKTVDLTRQVADCLGYTEHPYDPVTDQFEEGATKKYWEDMFDTIRQPLVDLVAEIKASPDQPDDSFLTGTFPEEDQRAFSMRLLEAIGFDLTRGRLDTAPHPFCTNFSVNDVRLTTRFKDYLPSAIFGTLHEAGHGMYEQNSPQGWDRTPLAGGVSLGWHESQSRTWENLIGRSKAFWQFFYADLQKTFPGLANKDLETFYRAVNKSEPSLIRVEADEVTYNLHIMVRFEMETGMLDGSIPVKDVPAVWNQKYEEYLGITPPDDARGCLQDVHWSGGLLGYFPTYSMGNILSYQVWNAMAQDLGDLHDLMSAGNFQPILDWLVAKVYSQGNRHLPQDLIRQVCGTGLDATPYITAISEKYREIYRLN